MVNHRTALPSAPPPPPSGQKLVREVFGLVLLFWAAFLVLSLLSYSPLDPTINYANSRSGPIRNSGGMFGAEISGLLVDMFGLAAFVWPMAFAVWGAACVSTWFSMPWWRWFGFALLGACLATLGVTFDVSIMDVRGGGMFGPHLVSRFSFYTGTAVSSLIWLFSFLLSLELCFGISWMGILSAAGAFAAARLASRGITRDSVWAAICARWRHFRYGPDEEPPIPLLDVDEGDTPEAEPPRLNYGDIAAAAVLPEPDEPSALFASFSSPAPAAKPVRLDAPAPSCVSPSPSPLPVNAEPAQASPTAPAGRDTSGDEALLLSIERRMRQKAPGKAVPDNEGKSPVSNRTAQDDDPAPWDESPQPDRSGITAASGGPASAGGGTLFTKAVSSGRKEEPTPAPSAAPAAAGEVPASFFEELDRALDEGARHQGADESAALAGAVAPAMLKTPPPQPKICRLPTTDLLQAATGSDSLPSRELMHAKGEQLMSCLNDFNISAELVRVTPGPVVTMFELRPAPGTKVSRILGLNEDIALNLKALAVRIQTMPGSDTVGVEIPNERRSTVNFRSILESEAFTQSNAPLTLSLGVNIGGVPVVADLAKMPHLLVGGTTGSGKSVCINAFLLSLLYKTQPDEMKLLMVDPKRVELAMYADLPHLIHPVVNEPAIAKNALDWAVHEMEHRYDLLARLGVRKFDAYNARLREMGPNRPPEFADLEPMPYLVIVVDELADLMMSAGKEVEASIVRLAQLARAAGIHLIVATQRPSVDVVTGLIKANFPSRVSFQVTNGHDSRTILDSTGAELLLGKGDMLFKPSGSKPFRLHGPFVPDADVEAVVNFWKAQRKPEYNIDFAEWGQPSPDDPRRAGVSASGSGMSEEEEMYNEIVQFALAQGKNLSISKLQRQFRIGFNKAARFMEQMQQDGIISPPGHANRSRDVIND